MTTLDPSHFPDISFRGKEHRSRGQAVAHLPQTPGLRLPAIPDLRFEQSYLKSIAPFVHTRRVGGSAEGEKAGGADGAGEEGHVEVVAVEWSRVAWVTTRDQLLSPLLQGIAM